MTWYRVALADGYTQPPIVASSWSHDEQLPEPLHWTWVADNGDLITRVDKGLFRLSFANNRSNWFHELDCRLLSWPDGQSTSADAVQRRQGAQDAGPGRRDRPGRRRPVHAGFQFDRDDAAAGGSRSTSTS